MAEKIPLKNAIKTVSRFLAELESSGIKINDAYLFGSTAHGSHNEWSDIDVAIWTRYRGDKFDFQLRLMEIAGRIDSAIEPHPFKPGEDNPFTREVLATGIRVGIN